MKKTTQKSAEGAVRDTSTAQAARDASINRDFDRVVCTRHLIHDWPVPIASSAKQPSEKVILIVEDDDEVRKISAALIQEIGFACILARSGCEALAILSAGERIDILFTDVLLRNGMDGKALAAKATELKPSLKILLTTASVGVHSSFPVLHKPFTKLSLAEALQAIDEPSH